RTNNIVFDNETFRISTETYMEPDGTSVASDQVAVSVEGRDFDFYGRGLTVRWNDVDQRLELLRIAHGDKLIIKNPSAMSGSLFGDKKKKEDQKSPDVTAAAQPPAGLWAPLAEMLASADPKGAGAALDASAQPSAAKGKRKRKTDAQSKPAQTRPARK